jgi:glycosyltransferase involved in cell wall biosynthesis
MRIIQLTPGTGSFYCGSCMRDNTLVRGLRELGHDALMVPLYLDPTLDEPSTAEGAPLLFGGINVYLQSKIPLFRKTPVWLDRLFDAPGLLRAAAKRSGMTSPRELGELTIASLEGESGPQVKELDRVVEWLTESAPPDVVILSNALLLGMARRIKERLRVPIMCSLQGEDAFMDTFPEPYRTQSWDLLSERSRDVDALVAASHYYGGVMTRRARLEPEKVHVIPNGILLDGYAPAPKPPAAPTIGYLARMIPGKGLVTIVDAFIALRSRGKVAAKLRIAGSMLDSDVPLVKRLKAKLEANRLGDQVEWLPNVTREEKIRFLQSLTCFSVPATYGEAFGLYIIEALAAGIPVVQPRHAAFPELVENTGGGILCEPDDPQALAIGLEGLLLDPRRARSLGLAGRKAVEERYSMQSMARSVDSVLQRMVQPAREAVAV